MRQCCPLGPRQSLPSMVGELYKAVAQSAFALLGLWWVVVQFRHGEWIPERGARRGAYGVSLHFLIPAIISLMALAAPGHSAVWRIAFGTAGVLGLAEAVRRMAARVPVKPRGASIALVVLAFTYVLVALVAIDTSLPKDVGVRLRPLEVEGLLVSILLLAGVNLAWLAFTEPAPDS
jgi:hypothetical protein